MATKISTKIIIGLSIILLVILSLYLYQKLSKANDEKAQIEARLNDSLKVYKDGNLELYHRVAGLENLNNNLNSILKEKNEKITSQFHIIAQLNNIISNGLGQLDTIKILDSNCVGLKLNYEDKNEFRNLKVNVYVDDPPIFHTEETFSPFGMLVKLTRNKDGIYGGYLEITPDTIKKFLTISNFDVQMDRDEYQGNPCDIIALKLAPAFSLGLNKDLTSLISIGAQALIKETHLIGYEKGINNDYHWVRYSYFPEFLSF